MEAIRPEEEGVGHAHSYGIGHRPPVHNILAGSLGLCAPKTIKLGKPRGSAIGFFISGALTIVAIPFGWGYWVELKVWLILVLTFSIAYFVLHTSIAVLLLIKGADQSIGTDGKIGTNSRHD